ncbi:MAG: tRNA (adenosine(37)-N6)-threonylcarbamoyltransferase complex transferase subunit TsaD, partial [Clostridiaceae bacterium]|nr:tRNA (adenosine(37)-N6)-threonylcarbamoyltransferase complex transferase subunit TsaD [Clostridiaceae bacterium]
QQAIVDVLVDHTMQAVEKTGLKRLAIAGGVAANSCLRRCLSEAAAKQQVTLSIPPLVLCTDNAAMIAAAGYFIHAAGRVDDLSLDAVPYLELAGLADH